MFIDFDLHAESGLSAIWAVDMSSHKSEIGLWDIRSRKRVAGIGEGPAPQQPRLSPDGKQVSFFDNVGRLYSYSVPERETQTLVDWPDRKAIFPSWSPDSRTIAFASRWNDLDPNKLPKLFRLDLPDRHIEPITSEEEPGTDAFPQWSPSGQRLIFHRIFFEPPRRYTTMMLTDRSGSFKTQLPNVEGSSQSTGRPCWSRDSQHVLVFEARGSERALKAFDIDDLTLVWHLEDEKLVGGCFDPRDQRVLCVQQDELHLNAFPSGDLIARLSLSNLSSVKIGTTGPEVAFGPGGETLYFLGTDGGLYRWDIGGSAELVLQDEPDQTTVGFTREDYRFRATDGREIPVQRCLPPDPNGRAIVYVEGGPGGTIRPNDLIVLRLLEEGYEVVRPAYRGTWGYGTEQFDANRGECGRGDVRDIVDCGLDWKTRFGTAGRPLALAGFSYGGYLTFLALGYPEAPWTCGITLWGATTVPPGAWATGLPSGLEVDEALRETSAVAHADRISFPLLILHGGRDNTPTKDVQSIQKAVHHSGRPCDLVVFEEDGHGLFTSQKEMLTRMLDFLDAYCK